MATSSSYSPPSIASSGITFANIAALKAYTLLTPIENKTVDVLGYYTPSDGGGGTFYYNPLSTILNDDGINIKPTSVGAGAGAFERVYNNQDVETAYFGAVADYKKIAVNVNGTSCTKREFADKGIMTGNSGPGAPNVFRYWGYQGGAPFLLQYYGVPVPFPNVGDVIEQFRNNAWLRIGVVYGYNGDGCLVTDENLLLNDTIRYQTRIKGLTNGTFSTEDVGKTMVIQDARLFTAFNSVAVGLNARITSVTAGVATIQNLDTNRGTISNTNAVVQSGVAVSNATIFRDATDGIAKAIKYCEVNKKNSPILPTGELGLMPFHSATWAAKPTFGTLPNTVEKSPFWCSENVGLIGRGEQTCNMNFEYAVPNRTGYFNPESSPGIHLFNCIIFFCEPKAGLETIKRFYGFTMSFPKDLSVLQPYVCFQDIGNNNYVTATRHAQKVYLNRIKVKCENRNIIPFRSNYGDIYTYDFTPVEGFIYRGRFDAGTTYVVNDVYMAANGICYYMYSNGVNLSAKPWHNNLVANAGIFVEDCEFESAGFEIKHSELYGDPTKKVGKKFEAKNSLLKGGFLKHYRNFTGTYTKTGSDYFVEIVEKEYSPLLFNRHFYYSTINVYNTPIEIKKRNEHVISSITQTGNNYIITLSTNYTDVTSAAAKLWMGVGEKLTELYLDAGSPSGSVSVTNGSPTVTVPMALTMRTLSEMHYYIGKTVRLYSRIDYVMLTDFQNNRKIKVGQWNTTAHPSGTTYPVTENCLNVISDITINATFREAAQAGRGHPIYNHQNLLTKFDNFIVEDCPDLFRISDGSSNKPGLFTIKNSPQPRVRGTEVFGTGYSTDYQIYYQCQGDVDIDNAGVFINDYGIWGSIKNCTRLSGFPFFGGNITNCVLNNMSIVGGNTEIEKCVFQSAIIRNPAIVNIKNCSGSLLINSGKTEIKESSIICKLYYDQGTPTTNLPLTDVTFLDSEILNTISQTSLTTPERILAKNAFKFNRSGLKANFSDGVGVTENHGLNFSIKRGLWPSVVNYNGSFALSLPQSYPVAVIDRTAMGIPSAGSGRILFIDAGTANQYRIGATTIDEIRFSNYFNGLSVDFNLFAQQKFKTGTSIILIPEEAGFITNTNAKLVPLTNSSRAIGTPIRFVYDKENGLWFEVANVFYD